MFTAKFFCNKPAQKNNTYNECQSNKYILYHLISIIINGYNNYFASVTSVALLFIETADFSKVSLVFVATSNIIVAPSISAILP